MNTSVSSAQRHQLRIIAGYRMRRVAHGWRAPGSPLIRAATMSDLVHAGWVVIRVYNGQPRPELTIVGQTAIEPARRRA